VVEWVKKLISSFKDRNRNLDGMLSIAGKEIKG
jgi:hypothetical protein